MLLPASSLCFFVTAFFLCFLFTAFSLRLTRAHTHAPRRLPPLQARRELAADLWRQILGRALKARVSFLDLTGADGAATAALLMLGIAAAAVAATRSRRSRGAGSRPAQPQS